MIVDSLETRQQFSGPGICERCGVRFDHRDPHHTFVKCGMGGGRRLDLPENLSGCCRLCHDILEANTDENTAMCAYIARRESQRQGCRLLPSQVFRWLFKCVNAPKFGPLPPRTWRRKDATATDASRGDSQAGHGRAVSEEQNTAGLVAGDSVPGDSPGSEPGDRPGGVPPGQSGWRSY